jgi:hypothetical protein
MVTWYCHMRISNNTDSDCIMETAKALILMWNNVMKSC